MSFSPILPFSGYSGWAFLKRTMANQQTAQQNTASAKREEAYFRANIGKINSAAELVDDRRLLSVALTAFGLEGDLKNKAFIRKVLEDGTLNPASLANRLANKQYHQLSAAFGFGDLGVPRNKISDFADQIISQYNSRSFETAVGAQNNNFRIALNAERDLAQLAAKPGTENLKWFTILGNPPLREAFQTALGLPSGFAGINLDQQLAVIKAKTRAAFGSDTISQFTDPTKVEKLVRTYLVRAEIAGQSQSSYAGSIALQLLSAGRR
ncbi:DUF1217 domain-containing protein [Xinfangfangia sp. CPCC 101601]|uniref:DUF1217 domain-containing protein n=1 Tax=Pseudogemmobacter lacusdianii TaxID=3069608 RepID=A0ABU0VU98_9RHOB|nr:DUF1217 domain-containing protein [Xinfangfangia sp. CPCC 101601]MDQ2065304.1 DUF1217 domain-containing protein [Xinfangfangia sp. CPCC 101601]